MDTEGRMLRVTEGKGMGAGDIELEKESILAIKNWIAVKPQVADDHIFLNKGDGPIGESGVRSLVAK